ncbi:MAG: hypothetical protein H0V24_04740 [Chloroflexia bacterium]|nr:hypothetical protein [Chloroflexia bacterium]
MSVTTGWPESEIVQRPVPPDWIVGLDAGQLRDYSALSILERREQPAAHAPVPGPVSFAERWGLKKLPAVPMEAHYACGHLERYPLGESYPDQVKRTVATLRQLRETIDRAGGGRLILCLDATGVGVAVADLYREADLSGATFAPITIHGGDTPSRDDRGGWRTPKRAIVSYLQVALQTGRLRIAASLPEAAILAQEFRNFRAKIKTSGNDSYGPAADWRESSHDDLLLSIGIAIWYSEHAMGGMSAAMSEALEQAMSWQSGPEYPR